MNLGKLKPNKIKAHKTSKHASGHMPVGASMSFGRKQGKPNNFAHKTKGVVLG